MELTANRRPFLYLPLAQHFEQKFHVTHRPVEIDGAARAASLIAAAHRAPQAFANTP